MSVKCVCMSLILLILLFASCQATQNITQTWLPFKFTDNVVDGANGPLMGFNDNIYMFAMLYLSDGEVIEVLYKFDLDLNVETRMNLTLLGRKDPFVGIYSFGSAISNRIYLPCSYSSLLEIDTINMEVVNQVSFDEYLVYSGFVSNDGSQVVLTADNHRIGLLILNASSLETIGFETLTPPLIGFWNSAPFCLSSLNVDGLAYCYGSVIDRSNVTREFMFTVSLETYEIIEFSAMNVSDYFIVAPLTSHDSHSLHQSQSHSQPDLFVVTSGGTDSYNITALDSNLQIVWSTQLPVNMTVVFGLQAFDRWIAVSLNAFSVTSNYVVELEASTGKEISVFKNANEGYLDFYNLFPQPVFEREKGVWTMAALDYVRNKSNPGVSLDSLTFSS